VENSDYIEGGYIKLYRKIKDNKYWLEHRKFSKAEAWIDLLLRAGFKDKTLTLGDVDVSLKAGEFVTSQVKLSESWRWHRETTAKFLKRLEKDEQITIKTSKRFSVITICNWSVYQMKGNEKPTTESTSIPASRRHQDDSRTSTINNDKNDKKGKKKEKEEVSEFEEVFGVNPETVIKTV